MSSSNNTESISNILSEAHFDMIFIDLDDFDKPWSALKKLASARPSRIALIVFKKHLNDHDIKKILSKADGYINKPFDVDTALQEIKALSRFQKSQIIINLFDITINLEQLKVYKNGKLLNLTFIQFKLLYLLAANSGRVISRIEIIEYIWGKNAFVVERNIDVHIRRIRGKLGDNNKRKRKYIEAEHNAGYRFLL